MTRYLKTVCVMAVVALPHASSAQGATMSFFITSQNPGDGVNLGGIAGADAHCASLAEAVGVTGKTWAAYLSTTTQNARDRIGAGPWVNATGVVVATDVDNLHSAENYLSKETALNEAGRIVNGRGDEPNRHDILTGSDATGGQTGRDSVSVVEHHAVRAQLGDIGHRRLLGADTVTGGRIEAHIIRDDQKDVWSGMRSDRRRKGRCSYADQAQAHG